MVMELMLNAKNGHEPHLSNTIHQGYKYTDCSAFAQKHTLPGFLTVPNIVTREGQNASIFTLIVG